MALSKDAYGATTTSTLLWYDAEALKKVKLPTDPKHPRAGALYNKERLELPLNEGTIKSIMEVGVKIPALFWRDTDTDEIWVVYGFQRYKNAIEANKRLSKEDRPGKDFPAMVARTNNPKELLGLIALENEIRTNNSPAARAEIAINMLNNGYTEPTIAMWMGTSPATVKNYISFLDCTSAVRKAVEKGLPISIAYQLAKLHPSEQNARLEKMLVEIRKNKPLAAPIALEGVDTDAALVPANKPKRNRRSVGRKLREIASSGEKPLMTKAELKLLQKEISDAEIRETVRQACLSLLNYILGKGEVPTFKEAYWKK